MRLLWNHSQAKLTILDFVYHVRRDTDKRTAVCDDLLQAFDKLDSTSSIPSIFCEAEHLLRIPVLSSDDPASLLKDTSTLVDRLHHDIYAISSSLLSHRGYLDSLKSHISSSCAEVNASVGNSLSHLSSDVSAMKDSMSQVSIGIRNQAAPPVLPSVGTNRSPQRDSVDRSASVILFGLPEGSLVDTRNLVDEISTFLTDSTKDSKDLFRIGKKTVDRCRPTIVKLRTVWDKRLLLAAKSKLKYFRQHKKDLSTTEGPLYHSLHWCFEASCE